LISIFVMAQGDPYLVHLVVFVDSLKKSLFISFASFELNHLFVLLNCRGLYIFWISISSQIHDLQIFSPIFRFSPMS
jgi:hypothetical protein